MAKVVVILALLLCASIASSKRPFKARDYSAYPRSNAKVEEKKEEAKKGDEGYDYLEEKEEKGLEKPFPGKPVGEKPEYKPDSKPGYGLQEKEIVGEKPGKLPELEKPEAGGYKPELEKKPDLGFGKPEYKPDVGGEKPDIKPDVSFGKPGYKPEIEIGKPGHQKPDFEVEKPGYKPEIAIGKPGHQKPDFELEKPGYKPEIEIGKPGHQKPDFGLEKPGYKPEVGKPDEKPGYGKPGVIIPGVLPPKKPYVPKPPRPIYGGIVPPRKGPKHQHGCFRPFSVHKGEGFHRRPIPSFVYRYFGFKKNDKKPGFPQKPLVEQPGFFRPHKPGYEKPVLEQKPGFEKPLFEQKPGFGKPTFEQKPGFETPVIVPRPGYEKPVLEPKPIVEYNKPGIIPSDPFKTPDFGGKPGGSYGKEVKEVKEETFDLSQVKNPEVKEEAKGYPPLPSQKGRTYSF